MDTLTRVSASLERVTDGIRRDTGLVDINNTPIGHQASTIMRTVRRSSRSGNRPPSRYRDGVDAPPGRTRESRDRVNKFRLDNQNDQKSVGIANEKLKIQERHTIG